MENRFGKIFRHRVPAGQGEAANQGEAAREIEEHIVKHFGEPSVVMHEITSRHVHIDVHIVPPGPDRTFYTLITSGMSDRAMNPPAEAAHLKYAELVLCMPPTWQPPAPHETMAERPPQTDWPLHWLVKLARFPHAYRTWLWWGHSMPNGDPPEPLASDTALCGWVLVEPRLIPNDFKIVKRGDGAATLLLAAVPVYPEEMRFKLAEGSEKLVERLDAAGVTELIDPRRINVALLQ